MKLQKFRIKNYKSIIDSGWCWLASDITILAGKNEAGKTAILEALKDYDRGKKTIRESANPIENDLKPVIYFNFLLSNEETKEIGNIINKRSSSFDRLKQEGITLIKYSSGQYRIEEELEGEIDSELLEKNEKVFNQIIRILENSDKKIIGDDSDYLFSQDFDENAIDVITSIISEVKENFINNTAVDEELKLEAQHILDELEPMYDELSDNYPSYQLLEYIKGRIPSVIFFSSFEGIIPFDTPLEKVLEEPSIRDFADVAKIDLNNLMTMEDTQYRMNYLDSHTASISGDFKGYWKQGDIDLVARIDGENLVLGVKELGKTFTFTFEQRSKGFQWFLTFYLKLNANQNPNRIILIDEPGLYLHANAQKDVLDVLEHISKETPVIFSSHSPYLIDPSKLNRIRLVLKTDEGTKIEKITKRADIETRTPIITAIGYDISKSFSLVSEKNLLLEGFSEYYYLLAFQKLINNKEFDNIALLPCVGATNVMKISSLLIGWDLSFSVLLDNDKTGKGVKKQLTDVFYLDEQSIIMINSNFGSSIEDIFTKEDFNNFVLNNKIAKEIPYESNSKYLKKAKEDKVVLSKNFYERVYNKEIKTKLSDDSLQNINNIFEKILLSFK